MALEDIISQLAQQQRGPPPGSPGTPTGPPDPKDFPPAFPTNPAPLPRLANIAPFQQRPDQEPLAPAPTDDVDAAKDTTAAEPGFEGMDAGKEPQREAFAAGNVPFRPYSPDRDAADWGSRDPVNDADLTASDMRSREDVPAPEETYGVISKSGRALEEWASPAVAEPAGIAAGIANTFGPILNMLSRGAFTRNYDRARLGVLHSQIAEFKMRQQQILFHTKLAAERSRQELFQYKDVFELWREGVINDGEAEKRIREIITGSQFSKIEQVLNTKGLGGFEDYVKFLDAQTRNLDASHSSLKKAAGDPGEEERQWGYRGGGRGGGDRREELPRKPGFSRDPAAAPEAPAEPEEKPGGASPSEEFDGAFKKLNIPDDVIKAGHDKFNGDPVEGLPKDPNSRVTRDANYVARQVRANVDRIAGMDLPLERKLQLLDAVDPQKARLIRGLLSYKTDPNRAEGIKTRGYDVGLASKFSGGKYNEGFYNTYQKYTDLNSSVGRQIARVNRTTEPLVGVISAIERLKIAEDEIIPANIWSKLGAEFWDGDPKYADLNAAIRTYNKEAIGATWATRQVPAEYTKKALEETPLYASKAQLRAAVRREGLAAWGAAEATNRVFKKQSGLDEDIPVMDREAMDDLETLRRWNPFTGQMPGDASPRLSSLGTTAKERSHKPGWIDERLDTWQPMEKADYEAAVTYIQKNPNTPKAEQLRQLIAPMQ